MCKKLFNCCCIPSKRKYTVSTSAAATTITASKTTIATTTDQEIFTIEKAAAATTTKMSSEKKLNFVIIMGSQREGRNCQRVATLVQSIVESQGASVTVLDPLALNLELIGQPLHFRPDPSKAPEVLLSTNETIKKADGFIIISPEYNRCPGPALLNLTNHFPPASYANRPLAIVTYSLGPQGGAMAAAQLRVHAGELGTVSIGRMVMIPQVTTLIDEGGATKDDKIKGLLMSQIQQLIWYANALKAYMVHTPMPVLVPTY